MDIRDMELDPYDYYEKYLKSQLKENATAFFDDLVKKTNTDVGKCRQDSKKYEKAKENDRKNEQSLGRWRFLQGFLIFFAVLGFLVFALSLSMIITKGAETGSIIALVLSIVVALISLLVIFLVTRKKILERKKLDKKYDQEVDKWKYQCLRNLYPINQEMAEDDFRTIVRKTTQAFVLDDRLSPEKLDLMVKAYQYDPKIGEKESLLSCQSGNIDSNPFLRLRVFRNDIRNKTYSGSLTISWTERVGSGKDAHYVTRTQTLVATSVHPAPFYSTYTAVVYGNQAAPDLCFDRRPSGLARDHDEKDVERFVKDAEKEMKERAEKEVARGGSFQPLANTTFEAFFGAYNRDNEVQYRLLFTPLAQQNMTELLLAKEPYGDDFTFRKINKMNIVSSLHGPSIPDYSPDMFLGETDLDVLKNKYVSTIESIFQSLYFELAPILAIPLYQQTDAGKYTIEKTGRHVSDYDAECFANAMDPSAFAHPDSSTPQILHVQYRESQGESDLFAVSSSSFRGESRVDYVSMMGGDGCVHSVPVPWIEYFPLTRTSELLVRKSDVDRSDYRKLMAEKEDFFQEKQAYREKLLSKKYFGIQLEDGYNYGQQDEEELSAFLSSAHGKE